MKTVQGERACGFLLYKDDPRRYLILIKKKRSQPEFPKGKIEKGEKAMEAALREVYEETGIEEVEWQEGYQYEFTYSFQRGKKQIKRKAIFFLGKVDQETIKLGHEHKEHLWLSPEESLKRMRHRNHRRAIEKAERFLKE